MPPAAETVVKPAPGPNPRPLTLPKFMEKSVPGVTVRPPAAVARVRRTAVCNVSDGLLSESCNVSMVVPVVKSVIVKLMVVESAPEKAFAPLLSGTKIAKPAVTVWFFGIPGAGITVVCAPALIDMLEN